jgi:hypothetical protein
MRRLMVRAAAVIAFASGLALAQVTFIKAETPPAEVFEAMDEFLAVLPAGVTCDSTDAWQVTGSLQEAAQMLLGELGGRGWDVLQTGQLQRSYVLIADPDPSDEFAVALGGILKEEGSENSLAYLARCKMAAGEEETPSATAGFY